MKKKLICIAVMLCIFVFACIAVSADTKFAGYTCISSAEDMMMLMGDSSLWNGKYYLADDITLPSYCKHTPIGTSAVPFTGIFDGDGHTISGLDISSSANLGLFGVIDNATVCNLTVSGSVVGTQNNVGGIIGFAYMNCTIKNCVNYVDVTVSSTSTAYTGHGGVVGKIGGATVGTLVIEDCVNYGNIKGVVATGGILGLDQHSGAGSKTIIRRCENYGQVTGSSSCAAGVFGYYYVGVASELIFTECANYADINGDRYVSGVFAAHIANGNQNKFAIDTTMSKLYNGGEITGAEATSGGIIGSFQTPSASGSVSIGDIFQNASSPVVGQVQGSTPFTVKRAYNAVGSTVIRTAPATVSLEACVTSGGDTSVLTGSSWSFESGSAELAAFHVNHVYDYKAASGGNAHYGVCYCGYESDEFLGHNFVKNGDVLECFDCGKISAPLKDDFIIAVGDAEATETPSVDVELTLPEGFGTALFEVTAPNGFTLKSIDVGEGDGSIYFVTSNEKVAVLRTGDAQGTANATLTFNYECEYAIEGNVVASVIECYDTDLDAMSYSTVAGNVAIDEAKNVPGDTDLDGTVTLSDALTILKALLEGETCVNGDMNGDRAVTLVDVLRAFKLISQ